MFCDSSSPFPEVIKLKYSLKLKIKPIDTCPKVASHCALFGFEIELKFYNLEVMSWVDCGISRPYSLNIFLCYVQGGQSRDAQLIISHFMRVFSSNQSMSSFFTLFDRFQK